MKDKIEQIILKMYLENTSISSTADEILSLLDENTGGVSDGDPHVLLLHDVGNRNASRSGLDESTPPSVEEPLATRTDTGNKCEHNFGSLSRLRCTKCGRHISDIGTYEHL